MSKSLLKKICMFCMITMFSIIINILYFGGEQKVYADFLNLSGKVTASSEILSVTNICDSQDQTKWFSDHSLTESQGGYYSINEWFRIDMGKPYVVSEYHLKPYINYSACGATDFAFYGSNVENANGNNDNDWVLIETITNNTSSSASGYYSKDGRGFTNTTPYRYYRIKITKTSMIDYAIIKEFSMYGTPVATIASVKPPFGGSYNQGDNLDFTVTFDEAVTVAGGTPYIPITLTTGGPAYAYYASGSGTTSLVFRYTVDSGQEDSDGIIISSTLEANGATMKNSSLMNSILTYRLPATSNIIIDNTAPIISGVSDTALYNTTLSPTFTEGTATLTRDGGSAVAYTSGTQIKEDGAYRLSVIDAAGNATTVDFAIDQTAPRVGGITNNTCYNTDVEAVFTEGEATLCKGEAVVEPYLSGTDIKEDGSYVLVVVDTAGNSTTISFEIDTKEPTGTITINNGDAQTYDYHLNLSITAEDGTGSGIIKMRFSLDNTIWGEWEPYTTTAYYSYYIDLYSTITIYIQLMDKAGNINSSMIYDDIIYSENSLSLGSGNSLTMTDNSVAQTVESASCKVTAVIVPLHATIDKNKITATVEHVKSSVTIKVKVSANATWELYSDKECKNVISKNKMKLKVGKNKAYIKVTAEDGTTKIYTITITRK